MQKKFYLSLVHFSAFFPSTVLYLTTDHFTWSLSFNSSLLNRTLLITRDLRGATAQIWQRPENITLAGPRQISLFQAHKYHDTLKLRLLRNSWGATCLFGGRSKQTVCPCPPKNSFRRRRFWLASQKLGLNLKLSLILRPNRRPSSFASWKINWHLKPWSGEVISLIWANTETNREQIWRSMRI